MGFSVVSSAESFIKAGQMKVLGVTSAQRSPLYPQWAAIAETLPGYEAVNWAGFCGPVGMPARTVQRLGEDLQAVVKEPGMAKALADMGIDVAPQGPAEFAAFIRSEIKRFAAVTKPLAPRQN
jgi:tripartite-type tricarboxylate transporter receptor subunit TctC